MMLPAAGASAETAKCFTVNVQNTKESYNYNEEVPYKVAVENNSKKKAVNVVTKVNIPDNVRILKSDGKIDGQTINWNNNVINAAKNGQYKLEKIAAGTYTLSEVKAPDGYQLSSAPLTFKVFETSDVQVVSMFNTMEVEVPNTSKNTLLFWFIGFLLLFSGLSIFSYTYLKRQG